MAMQFQGSVTVGGTALFVTSATVNLPHTPIAPENVWGSGWMVNFASGHFDPTFTVSFPWFQSYGTSLLSKCIDENAATTGIRNTFMTANIYNGGLNIAYTGVKCASLSFSIDALGGAAVTCSATFVAKTATISSSNPGANTPPVNVDGQTPVPSYLMTASAVINGVAIPSTVITSLNIEINNNPFKLYTLSGSENATDIQLGLLNVTGNYMFYESGVAITTAKVGSLIVAGGGINFNIPAVLINSFNSDISGPNQKPLAAVTWQGFGTSSTPPIVVS